MHPNVEIGTKDIVDWAVSTYLERTGKIFRDPDRGVRSLYQREYTNTILNMQKINAKKILQPSRKIRF